MEPGTPHPHSSSELHGNNFPKLEPVNTMAPVRPFMTTLPHSHQQHPMHIHPGHQGHLGAMDNGQRLWEAPPPQTTLSAMPSVSSTHLMRPSEQTSPDSSTSAKISPDNTSYNDFANGSDARRKGEFTRKVE